eukprot:7978318-Karenia_brevis.AAC.1
MVLCLRTRSFHKDRCACGEPAGALSVPPAVVSATAGGQSHRRVTVGGWGVSWSANRIVAMADV